MNRYTKAHEDHVYKDLVYKMIKYTKTDEAALKHMKSHTSKWTISEL